ncbi:hypothetical protein AAFF_G00277540, partial [Aldrovandia affinis]
MAKTAAQWQREFRARRDADPVRRENSQRSEHQRWKRDVEAGKKRKIDDLSERAQRLRCKKWREAKQRQKQREETLRKLDCKCFNTQHFIFDTKVSSAVSQNEMQINWGNPQLCGQW